MSYDLTIRGKAPEIDDREVAETKKALGAIEAQMKADGSNKEEAYWEAYNAHQNALNPESRKYSNRTFSEMVEVMSTTGMGRYAFAPEFDLEEPDESEEGNLDAYADYMEAKDEWLKKSSDEDDVTGIPLHKFSTNEGWIVTQDECIQALSAWDEVDLTQLSVEQDKLIRTERWRDFLDFMGWASSNRGFEVW